mmetsp:Transcript_8185/g.17670  ORF Transcript_8185/g.17670 Transcript_8185/m.17670 type:complete len:150 (+) Transcript_8185:82-531(+)
MNHSSSDEEHLPLPLSHPARIIECGSKNERNRGWGQSMELAHQQEVGQRRIKRKLNCDSDNDNDDDVVAVDLNQFRNTEVGKGYQAKHVVRQRSATTEKVKTTTINSKVNVHRGDDAGSNRGISIEIDLLLQNRGLRALRREIENILSS